MTPVRQMVQHVTGYVAQQAGRAAGSVPGVAGAALVSYGLYRAWLPLGFVAAGAFLLLIDRRVP